MARVYTSDKDLWFERGTYSLFGVDSKADQTWGVYARSLIAFSAVSLVLLYLLQRLQHYLPLSLGLPNVESGLAFNTAASFVANTNWQSYSPEVTMGHLVQFAGLAVQNFLSAAVGIDRRDRADPRLRPGQDRPARQLLGRPDPDHRCGSCCRSPSSARLVLVAMGVVQNFSGGHEVTSVVGQTQTIPGGPVASQEVIKELGTNGGGFYNANSGHPFENPNALSNLFEIFLLLVIPVCLTRTFGLMIKDKRQGYAILGVMGTLWAAFTFSATFFENQGAGTATQAAGAAMEGKETRFGEWASALFATSTTGTSTGAVNSAHDSFTPLGGGTALFHMMLGEVTPGGTGTGLYGMLILADPDRVRRRPDGRPDAGVPEEEDHRARDEAGLAVHPDDADRRPGRCRRSRWGWPWRGPRSSTPTARTGSPKCCTRSPRPATTTAVRSAVSARTSRSTTPLSGW